MKKTVVVATLVAALSNASSSAFAEVKIEETIVGPANAGGLYIVSQNEARIAYIGAKGTRTVVSVDGVEGPVLDELIGGAPAIPGQLLVHNANAGGIFNGTASAVIFSESGAHYAYIGRQGNEYVVIHDGKEVGRGPRSALAIQPGRWLGLSPLGKHTLWFEMKTEDGRGIHRLVMNGKPGPWAGHQDLKPVFSPDDSRYVYLAGTVEDYKKPMLIVDGKVASYVGGNLQFTADNKLLLTATDLKDVLVEGKRMSINAYMGIEKVVPAPVGGRFAVIVRKKNINYQGVGTLYLDGKEVPGTEGAMDLTFSPDGKRYALRCANHEARSAFVVIDGKKGTEYQSVTDKFYWSPDSSKVAYQISSSGRNFVVVNTEEFPVDLVHALMRAPIRFSANGRYAFSSNDGSNRNFLTIVDGKPVLPAGVYPDGQSFEFSENGARYAFMVGQIGRQGMTAIVDNGQMNATLAPGNFTNFSSTQFSNEYFNTNFILSPDGKYLARMARTPQNASPGLYVNDKLAFPTPTPVINPTFTPDSKHLCWLGVEMRGASQPGRDYVAYVDGHPAVRLTSENMIRTMGAWSMGADGVVTLLGVVGDTVKRFRITAPPDTNIDKMITQAEEKQTRAVAEAAAAKKKAEDDALAAKQAAEAAATKAKADQAARAAAATKARQDALEAQKKARLLQLENAKRKRQGLPPLKELP